MPVPLVAPVDASARGRICGDCWRKYQFTGEELWATDEPCVFFVCHMGSAIPSREHFLFRFPVLGRERDCGQCLFECYRTRIIILTNTCVFVCRGELVWSLHATKQVRCQRT